MIMAISIVNDTLSKSHNGRVVHREKISRRRMQNRMAQSAVIEHDAACWHLLSSPSISNVAVVVEVPVFLLTLIETVPCPSTIVPFATVQWKVSFWLAFRPSMLTEKVKGWSGFVAAVGHSILIVGQSSPVK